MRLNAEIQKCAWLEFSVQRLIVMPLVLSVIFYITAQSPHPIGNIVYVSCFILVLLLGVWGGHKASSAVLDEINNNTWDFQRLSPVSPGSLAFGKIFGSTLYCWYGALMVLAVYIYYCLVGLIPNYYLFCNIVTIIFSALLCHSFALLASLQSIQVKIPGRSKIQSIGAHIVGVGLASVFISGIKHASYNGIIDFDYAPEIYWYGQGYTNNEFFAVLSVVAFIWIAGGVYWQMRNQLRMRSGPWLWIAFVIFMMFFFAGFSNKYFAKYVGDSGLLNSYYVGMLLLYCMAFLEPWDGLLYRRLLENWKKRNIKDLINLFPRWFSTFILVAIVLAFLPFYYNDNTIKLLSVVACFCFAIRDIALLHYCKLLPTARRAQTATLFYLFLLYGLIPIFLLSTNSKTAISLFWVVPMPEVIMNSLVSAGLQAILFVLLAFNRWQKYWR